ncbi:MAG TPA: sodium/proton-translocating pyrophosphatase, partial [Vicinamibacterales bacterium]
MAMRLIQRVALVFALAMLLSPVILAAQPEDAAHHRPGGEVNIQLPDLNQGDFLGMTGHQILMSGLVVCVLGLLFGLWTYTAVKNLPVHKSMSDVSAIIYETCKAYLIQQGKFLLILELFIGTVMVAYFWLTDLEPSRIAIVIVFSLIGIAGSYGVAWYGIRINTLANSRTAFASLQGKA